MNSKRVPRWVSVGVLVSLSFASNPKLFGQVVLVDNLNEGALSFFGVAQGFPVAQGFTTPAVEGLSLDTVRLRMVESTSGTGGFSVALYSNSESATPGTLLLTLTGSTDPGASSIYDYTGSLALAPNTTYWVVASTPSGQYWWASTASSGNSGSAVLTAPLFEAGTWQSLHTPPYFLRMEVTAVPEPAAWAAASALFLGGFALVRRLRRV